MNATLWLPYFKQGDDLSHFLSQEEDQAKALENHAQMMEETAKLLRKVAVYAKDIEINADCHFIGIEGPDAIIQEMIDDGLVQLDEFDDDDWDDELDDLEDEDE